MSNYKYSGGLVIESNDPIYAMAYDMDSYHELSLPERQGLENMVKAVIHLPVEQASAELKEMVEKNNHIARTEAFKEFKNWGVPR